jgi:BirA family transcriptional regulator, biotin operon repressor / biotin---[acetyl-CoA-carboxylase] ligase
MPQDGFSLMILDSVDSTNNYAMQKVHAGMAKHGDSYFANEQTSGKGQRGKAWQSNKGKNIILTILLEPATLKLLHPFHLSVAVATACYDFLKIYAGDKIKIKWPNDIYWRDRKAGGILIENVLRGKEWRWAIVGIGININQDEFPSTLKNPVSLKQITGVEFNVVDLATALQEMVLKKASQSFEELLKEYNAHLYKRNEIVSLRHKIGVLTAMIKGVNEDGQLVVFSDKEERFDFGEIEWIV